MHKGALVKMQTTDVRCTVGYLVLSAITVCKKTHSQCKQLGGSRLKNCTNKQIHLLYTTKAHSPRMKTNNNNVVCCCFILQITFLHQTPKQDISILEPVFNHPTGRNKILIGHITYVIITQWKKLEL